ncbi:hypothetical protein [Streptomyces sp. DT171]|uniref:hypothetical protein n=1 Tax=Streptomyces sp. DT171 TaxID=3416524 RepID=UPI003CE8B5DB
MTYSADVEIPPGRVVCWECHGTGRTASDYYHACDRPLCQHDTPTIECGTCDGQGHTEVSDS